MVRHFHILPNVQTTENLSAYRHDFDTLSDVAETLVLDDVIREPPPDPSSIPRIKRNHTPMLLPCTLYKEEGPRKNDNIESINLIVLDVDEPESVAMVDRIIRRRGWECFTYSTLSSTTEKEKRRFILYPDRPIDADEWKAKIFPWIFAITGSRIDSQCKDASRLQAVPAYTPHYLEMIPGVPFAVDRCVNVTGAQADWQLLRLKLLDIADTWKNKRKETLKRSGKALHSLLSGDEVFAPEGERDETAFMLALSLSKTFGNNSNEVSAFLVNVESAVEDAWPGEYATFCDKFDRVCATEGKANIDPDRQRAIDIERKGMGLYTLEELTAHENAPRLVLVGKNVFIREIKDIETVVYHGPHSMTDAKTHAHFKLAPDPEVDFMVMGANDTVRQRSMQELITAYGVSARNLTPEIDLSAPGTHFDWDRNTLIRCPVPTRIREIKPRFVPEIKNWTSLMFGGDATLSFAKFCMWLAGFPDLTRPLSCLYLHGPAGSGKNILAAGLSRYWLYSSRPLPTEAKVLGTDHNEAIMTCPFIHIDEALPVKVTMDDLKKEIVASQRTMNEKYISHQPVTGCLRFLATDNNGDLFSSVADKKAHTLASYAALGDRFVSLVVEGTATACPATNYLTSLGDSAHHIFVTSDGMIAHALWLNKKYGFPKEGRYGVKPLTTSVHTFASNAGLNAKASEALLRAIVEKKDLEMLLYDEEKAIIYLSVARLWDRWESVTKDRGTPPNQKQLAQSFAHLVDPRWPKGTRKRYKGNMRRWVVINLARLENYIEDSNQPAYDLEMVEDGLKKFKLGKQEKEEDENSQS